LPEGGRVVMGKPKLEDYKTATAWIKAMDEYKAVKNNTSSKPKAKRKKSSSSSQGVLEIDYGFGKNTPIEKQHLGPLTRAVAKSDAVLQAGKYIGPRTNVKRAKRDAEITKRIGNEVKQSIKKGNPPSSETRTRYYEELNKERATYNLPPKEEGKIPKQYLPKKQAKGGYVKKYAKGGGVRKVRS
jgi:hypothetical protein|tara:strand:+ start:20 stop:574 length:555 start_codon:yes stop_codon:yes gene_type:complete